MKGGGKVRGAKW